MAAQNLSFKRMSPRFDAAIFPFFFFLFAKRIRDSKNFVNFNIFFSLRKRLVCQGESQFGLKGFKKHSA